MEKRADWTSSRSEEAAPLSGPAPTGGAVLAGEVDNGTNVCVDASRPGPEELLGPANGDPSPPSELRDAYICYRNK